MALLSATAILVATLLYYGIKYDVLKQAQKLDLLGAHFILAIYTIGYALAEKKQVEIIWWGSLSKFTRFGKVSPCTVGSM